MMPRSISWLPWTWVGCTLHYWWSTIPSSWSHNTPPMCGTTPTYLGENCGPGFDLFKFSQNELRCPCRITQCTRYLSLKEPGCDQTFWGSQLGQCDSWSDRYQFFQCIWRYKTSTQNTKPKIQEVGWNFNFGSPPCSFGHTWSGGGKQLPYVLLEEDGMVGKANRAQRGFENLMEQLEILENVLHMRQLEHQLEDQFGHHSYFSSWFESILNRPRFFLDGNIPIIVHTTGNVDLQ